MTLNELPEEQGGVLAEFAVVGAEGRGEVGVDVEFASNFAMDEDGDDDFGFGFERAGQIAGVGIDVVDHDGFASGSRRTADALVERDARVGSHSAFERTEDEDIAITFLFEHVETNPVVTCKLFVE